jgi:hypothetical protein
MQSKPTVPANPEIKRLAPGVFAIRGRNDWYTIARGRGCSCPAGRSGRRCWHLDAVKVWAAHNTPVWTPAVDGACGAV